MINFRYQVSVEDVQMKGHANAKAQFTLPPKAIVTAVWKKPKGRTFDTGNDE